VFFFVEAVSSERKGQRRAGPSRVERLVLVSHIEVTVSVVRRSPSVPA
jgi:hypothetical protein